MKLESTRLALPVILLLSLVFPARAAEQKLTFTPDSTQITWILDATGHDVEGGFNLVSGNLTWNDETGAAEGTITIDATSARTGNKSRDETMHEEVLESDEYPHFVFKAARVEGHVKDAGESSVKLHGVLSIHGQDHAFTLPARVTKTNGHLKIVSTFEIPFIEWGMKDPSILILRVDKVVKVTLSASPAWSAVEAPAQAGVR